MIKLDVIDHRSVDLQDVRPAVVIVIDKFHGNTAQENGFVADAGAEGGVGESAVVIVVVEAIQFEIEMGDVDVLPAIAIEIGGVNPHACFVAAVFTGGDAGDERDILERAVMFVDE